jgi:hypothetical protein
MTITLPFFFLTTHLAVGILLVLLTVSTEVKKNFFRFNAIVACVLLGLSFLIRPSALFNKTSNFYILAICAALVLGYVVTLRFNRPGLSRALLYLSVLSGLTTWSIDIDVLRYYASYPMSDQILFVNFFLSTLLLGSVTLAMIMGHWYLVDPQALHRPSQENDVTVHNRRRRPDYHGARHAGLLLGQRRALGSGGCVHNS